MAQFTRQALVDSLSSAANHAYAMNGLGYHRLNKILERLATAVELEEDAFIDKFTFAAIKAMEDKQE